MGASNETRRLVGAVGAAKRHHPEHVPDLARDLRASQLRDHIKAVVDAAPPLTDAQRTELATMLGGVR